MAGKVEIIVTAVDKASGVLNKTGDEIRGMQSAVTEFSKAAGPYIAAFTAIVAAVMKVAEAAGEQEIALTKLNATLISTGRQSEITAGQLADMANVAMRNSIFDDEKILEATNALLRFSSVSSENIPAITTVVLDMASALGTDAAGAAEMLGRALESGVIPRTWGFSKALKAQIQESITAGDEGKALGLIIDELTRRFGGQGLAALTTYTGATQALKNEMMELAEVGGSQGILQILTLLKFALADLLVAGQDAALGMQKVEGSIKDVPLDELNAALAETKTQLAGATNYSEKYMLVQREAAIQTEINRREAEKGAIVIDGFGSSYKNLTIEVNNAKTAVKDFNVAMSDTEKFNFIMTFQAKSEDFETTKAALLEKMKGLRDEILAATAAGDFEALPGLKQDLMDTTKEIDKQKEAWVKWQKQTAFSIISTKLLAQGVDLGEILKLGEDFGVLDPEVVAQAQAMLESITKVDNSNLHDAAKDLKYIVSQDGRVITIYVNQITTESTGSPTSGAAGGASFTVPYGYPNDSYMLGLSSGEHVEVTTTGQKGAIGGGTVNNHYYYGAKILLERGYENEILARLTE